jgi:hypothetical protein
LRLLAVFDAIHTTGSATRAADALAHHNPGNQWLRCTVWELLATPGI